jgi:hypothetical protein
MSDGRESKEKTSGTSSLENGMSEAELASEEEGVSLLNILLILARHKTFIVRTVFVFTIVGVAYSLVAPKEYTSSAKVVREAESKGTDLSGGLGGLAGGVTGGALSGLLGGVSGGGLGPESFPEVLKGRTVKLAVVRDTFRFPNVERPMTFVDYVNRPSGIFETVLRYTLRLPWTLKKGLASIVSDSPASSRKSQATTPTVPSEEVEDALEAIDGMMRTRINPENGLMTILVTAGGRQLSASIVESFISHLRRRVRDIRTKKVRDRLQFTKQRFQEAEQELGRAEDRLEQFLDRNQSLRSPKLQFQRDRLQRKVTFKQQLYSKLQSQLTQVQLDLQRRKPVVTVVEGPVPPRLRSAPKRTAIVILSAGLGVLISCVIAVVWYNFRHARLEEEDRKKVKEIRDRLSPKSVQKFL